MKMFDPFTNVTGMVAECQRPYEDVSRPSYHKQVASCPTLLHIHLSFMPSDKNVSNPVQKTCLQQVEDS